MSHEGPYFASPTTGPVTDAAAPTPALDEDDMDVEPSDSRAREIARLRGEIDEINLELLHLLRRRMETVQAMARLKKQLHWKAYDPGREAEMIRHLSEHVRPPMLPEDIERIFKAIFACGLAVQHREPSPTAAVASPADPPSRPPRKR